MTLSKEAPRSIKDLQFITVKEFQSALNKAGVPTPLQETIMLQMAAISPEGMLTLLFESLPEYEKAELEAKGAARLEEEIKQDVFDTFGGLFDKYLGEVARKVLGFRLGNLSAAERMQIENIRTDLKIPGMFNPDT